MVEGVMMQRSCARAGAKVVLATRYGSRVRTTCSTAVRAASVGAPVRSGPGKVSLSCVGAGSLAGAGASAGGAKGARRNLSASSSQVTSTVSEVQRVLGIDLRGKKAFVAGVADDKGFGWAISKALAEAGCEIILGTWVPALKIFETSYRRGKFDENAMLSDGSKMEFKHVYPMDAVFDTLADVPEEVRTNKRYEAADGDFSVAGVAKRVKEDYGNVDIVIHSLANGPEVQKPLLETSRHGYLAALSASSYSFISMMQHFGPLMNKGGAAVSLTYLASERVIPGYGGGMSSAKAALESDTQVLAFEAGRKYGVRVNTISAGPLGSRAARAIGFIDDMINYSMANAPIEKELAAEEVANVAAFLCSPLASAITGSCIYVDNGLNTMGLAMDSKALERVDD
ncbi:enoyl-[acyl-carrier-protein] reductase [Chloropicon primus]|uniref:Enoyl-[acyl-carrier-protein] reductase n=1 Tax=Chloropicon primus TaxID=1764295 RepID=A0A5B8MED4_9CHLO|nr:enoyl-[acyl-carrier-protein] reductase [Chloropicon primus]UPQ96878.1 enoyl-[acyl-carrier-protein] reductase [Chloropicon primus]|mmetsp:Transcript_32856/g.71028  ORF Transcript_32856/g.71028 Transcript_32856/m.71028 type:complete len:399 (+) Transcript_32856:74-1270(+)|eukprot:QDZ17662.1 enoyl-[acyl-carrier-protein] reductase [Chloropicon primus]